MTLTNADVARMLREIRLLMEFDGQAFFKFMAYERAADAIENATPVAGLIASGELQKLPGVGKTIAGRVEEIVQTGRSSFLDELLAKYPPTVLELLAVQGLGMKTAQMLFSTHGVASLADLERALSEGRLAGTPRFGEKSIENLKRGVLAYKGRGRRTPLGIALPIARDAIEYIRAGADLDQITYAGSLRRAETSVGDIDIVCTSRDAAAVIARFVNWDRAEAVLSEGETKATIWLAGGLQIDLRVLADELYGNLLQHFTGSREHNIQLRELAVRRGLRVSENGILEVATGNVQRCATETEVYAALGLTYIPPEMRLGLGEIEAAGNGTLPVPIALEDLRGDFHMHCSWSDGANTLEEMIAAAAARGYEYHAISDHSWGRGSMGLDPADLREQRNRVEEIGKKFGIRTLCASEVDILPDGSLDYDDAVLAELDVVIASVHGALRMSREEMTQRLIRACENPYVSILGHPTGRQSGAFEGYEVDIDAVAQAAARTGTALEIDGHPSRLDLPGALAGRAATFGATFTIDSDAHAVAQLDNVAYGIGQARRAWLTPAQVLNAQPLDAVLEFVAKKRSAAV
jgi:DNA polymerase (family 10)